MICTAVTMLALTGAWRALAQDLDAG